jgi:hypothetical protein
MALSCLITLVFTTSLTVDAFTPIKFTVLICGVLYIYSRYWSFIFGRILESKGLNSLIWAFFIHSIIVLLANSYSISERLFGSQGRYFGFITIWAIFLLGVANYLAVKHKKLPLHLLFRYLLFTNLIVAFVFFIQKFEIAFLDFQNDYSVLPSTLGNPNFLAAFIAASFYSGTYVLFSSKRKIKFNNLLATTSIISSLYIVAISNSLQGPLGIAIGAVLLVALFFAFRRPKPTLLLVLLFSILSTPFIRGLFGKGYFGDRLEQSTLVIRSMYWAIAGRIGLESPVIGQGFDTYLDHYRMFRSYDEVKVYGTGLISDSPHNLFLDFLVAGGFPYLFWAVAGSSYVVFAAIKTFRQVKTEKKEITEFVFLCAIWGVFSLLSLINPFQIAVNIWNVVIGFLLVGKYHQFKEGNQKVDKRTNLDKRKKLYMKYPLIASLIIFLNPALGVLPMVTEIRFRSAVEKSDYQALRKVSTDWPFSGSRVVAISQGILDSSLKLTSSADSNILRELREMIRRAHTDALAATKINKNSFELWRFIFYNHPDQSVRAKARMNLVRLDPQDLVWLTTRP